METKCGHPIRLLILRLAFPMHSHTRALLLREIPTFLEIMTILCRLKGLPCLVPDCWTHCGWKMELEKPRILLQP